MMFFYLRYKPLLKLLLLLTTLTLCPAQAMESNIDKQSQLMLILAEAEDYLAVKPSKTIELLTNVDDITALNTQSSIRWYLALIRASVPANNRLLFENSIKELLTFQDSPYFKERLPTILSGMGIWLRKSGYRAEAKLCLLCALKYTNDDKIKMILMNSLAVNSRYMGELDFARKIYLNVKALATKLTLTASLASVDNNLGAMAFEQEEFAKAEEYFRSSLALSQSISKRSNHVTAGLNLLFTFYLQGELLNYQRLYTPMERLINVFPNPEKKANLLLLNTAFNVDLGKSITEKQKDELLIAYSKLTNRKEQAIISKYLGNKLGIEFIVSPDIETVSLEKSWLNEIDFCDWDEFSSMSNDQILNAF